MAERQADPRCRCGALHSDPLHVIDHQFMLATEREEFQMTTSEAIFTLQELAREAAEQAAKAASAYAEKRRLDYDHDARSAGVQAFKRQLSIQTTPEQWVSTGEPGYSDNDFSAITEIDGLRFLAHQHYESGFGYSYTLYLLRRCERSDDLAFHDQQAEIQSLAGLHAVLQPDSDSGFWECPTCAWRREEEYPEHADEAATAPSRTPADELYELLCRVVRDEIVASQEA